MLPCQHVDASVVAAPAELEDLAAGWTVRHHPTPATPPHPAHPSGPPGWPADPAAAATAPHTPDNSGVGAQLSEGTTFTAVDAGGTPCEWIKTDCKAETKLSDAVYFHMHGGGHYRGSSRVAPYCSYVSSLAGVDCLSVLTSLIRCAGCPSSCADRAIDA